VLLTVYVDEIHELTDQINQGNHRIQEVEKISKRFESEKDELQVTLEEAEAALEQEEAKVERALADVAAARDETERRLVEKDEEFESLRYMQCFMLCFNTVSIAFHKVISKPIVIYGGV